MSSIECGACQELRENAPEFVENGVTSTVCTSLQNDTGLNPSLTVLHTDKQDLHTANDCLIGQMDAQLEAFDTCDWKKFMHRFIPNLYELLKAIICSLGGSWTKIHYLETHQAANMKIKRCEYAMDNIPVTGLDDTNIKFILDIPAGYTYMAIGSIEIRNATVNGQNESHIAIIEYHTHGNQSQVWLHVQNTQYEEARILVKVNVLFCTSANIEYIGDNWQDWDGDPDQHPNP